MSRDVRKMSLKELLELDSSTLTSEESEVVERRLIQYANKRIKNVKKDKLAKYGGVRKREFKEYKPRKNASAKNRRGNVVRSRRIKNIENVRSFLKDKTTVTEARKRVRDIIKTVKEQTGLNLKPRQLKKFFRIWKYAKELMGGDEEAVKGKYSKVWQAIAQAVKEGKSEDEALEIAENTIRKEYEYRKEFAKNLDAEENELEDEESEE